MRYRVFSSDGRLLDTSPEPGIPVAVSVLFHAAADILRTMTVGEKRRIWLPKSLSAGFPATWPRADVIVDLEVIAVSP